MTYQFKTSFLTAGLIAIAFFGSIFAAGVGVGRWSVVQDTSCPFELERMEIVPQTPTAYHHITGHRAPKHGVAVPLPPTRPKGV